MVRGGNSANGRSLAYVVMVGLFLRNSPASAALAAHRFAYPRSRAFLRMLLTKNILLLLSFFDRHACRAATLCQHTPSSLLLRYG